MNHCPNLRLLGAGIQVSRASCLLVADVLCRMLTWKGGSLSAVAVIGSVHGPQAVSLKQMAGITC